MPLILGRKGVELLFDHRWRWRRSSRCPRWKTATENKATGVFVYSRVCHDTILGLPPQKKDSRPIFAGLFGSLIEILWGIIKYHWLPLSAYQNFRSLVEHVHEVLDQVGPRHIISFAAMDV